MQVGAIQNQSFSGKIKETKKGNKYETSNDGKKLYPLITAGAAGIVTAFELQKGTFENYYKEEMKEIQKVFGKSGTKAAMVGIVVAGAALGGFIYGAIIDALANGRRRKDSDKFAETGESPTNTNKGKVVCAGIGLVLGGISLTLMNFHEKFESFTAKLLNSFNTFIPIASVKDSDVPTSAVNEIKKPAASLIKTVSEEVPFKYSKAAKYSVIPMAILSWLIPGAIYDHAVNKFRAHLTNKADKIEKATEAEARLDAKIDAKIEEKLKAKLEDSVEEKFEESVAA